MRDLLLCLSSSVIPVSRFVRQSLHPVAPVLSAEFTDFRLAVKPVRNFVCALGQNATNCRSKVQDEWPDEHVFPVYFSSNRPEDASVIKPEVEFHDGGQTTSVVFSLLAAVPVLLLAGYGCLA